MVANWVCYRQDMFRIHFIHHYAGKPDPDGISIKAAVDGIVRAGYVEDDNQDCMLSPMQTIKRASRANEHTEIYLMDVNVEDMVIAHDLQAVDDNGANVYTYEEAFNYTLIDRIVIPFPLPTLNRILAMDRFSKVPARQYIHQLMWLGKNKYFNSEGLPTSESFTWSKPDVCPWQDTTRPWSHFVQRYYKVVLNRKLAPAVFDAKKKLAP